MNSIEQIKQAADIVEIIQPYVELVKFGQNWKGRCPFHTEKTPSFYVHPGKQIYKCFGCGKSGDAFTFLQEIERLTFPEALQKIAEKYNIPLENYNPPSPKELIKKQNMLQAMQATSLFYQQQLQANNRPLKYLTDTCQISQETIKKFQIGYAPRGPFAIKNTIQNQDSTPYIQAGILKHNESDFLTDRIIYPILNKYSKPIAFSGRAPAGIQPKYLHTQETDLFHKSHELYNIDKAIERSKELRTAIIVEGFTDVIACHTTTIFPTVASMGTSLTPQQSKIMKRHFDRIIIMYDGDEAGQSATKRALHILLSAGFQDVLIAHIPNNLDPHSLYISEGPEALSASASDAIGWFQYYTRNYTPDQTIQEKLSLIDLLTPIIAANVNSIIADHQIKELANITDTPTELIQEHMIKQSSPFKNYNTAHLKSEQRPSFHESILLSILHDHPLLIQQNNISPESFSNPIAANIMSHIINNTTPANPVELEIFDSIRFQQSYIHESYRDKITHLIDKINKEKAINTNKDLIYSIINDNNSKQ